MKTLVASADEPERRPKASPAYSVTSCSAVAWTPPVSVTTGQQVQVRWVVAAR